MTTAAVARHHAGSHEKLPADHFGRVQDRLGTVGIVGDLRLLG
jgi:hypothetical protein